MAPRRDPDLLRRYLAALAVNSAGLVAEESLREAAGINTRTAHAYQALFQRMFVLDLVPAWFSNRVKRLVKTPKRYLVDPALVAAVLGLGREAILYGPDMIGRLMDTFVAAQLRAELAVSNLSPRPYHLREEHGRREVNLVIETASGTLIGIEIKASAIVTAHDTWPGCGMRQATRSPLVWFCTRDRTSSRSAIAWSPHRSPRSGPDIRAAQPGRRYHYRP